MYKYNILVKIYKEYYICVLFNYAYTVYHVFKCI